MGKNFRHLTQAAISIHPGSTLEKLTAKIKHMNLEKYKIILLLIGTHDLTPKSTWQWYKDTQRRGGDKYPTLPHQIKTPSAEVQMKYRKLIL